MGGQEVRPPARRLALHHVGADAGSVLPHIAQQTYDAAGARSGGTAITSHAPHYFEDHPSCSPKPRYSLGTRCHRPDDVRFTSPGLESRGTLGLRACSRWRVRWRQPRPVRW